MLPLGTHLLLELHGCPPDLLNDLEQVVEAVKAAAREAKTELLNLAQHRFDPQGVTAVALLAESHISVHTWPELGYAAADVFTCGAHTQPQAACDELVRRLQASHHILKTMDRGTLPGAGRPARVPHAVNG